MIFVNWSPGFMSTRAPEVHLQAQLVPIANALVECYKRRIPQFSEFREDCRLTGSNPWRKSEYSEKLCAGLATVAVESSELVREVHDMAGRQLV